jgi:hypothetical protein
MRTLFAAALAALGVALAVAVVTAGSGGTDPLELDPIGSTTPVTTSTGEPNDISGPCDEAEHRNDPRCAGVTGVVTAPGITTDDADISGPCDEAEHRNDPRCAGGAADDDGNDNDDDNGEDRSGSNSGPH